ncbi:Membrane-bound lytic murein transglycosylase C [Candidatus Westeberhardia cardiocondylae]|uniref:peptidoglycan lytic exotransglycosylase n=1 Tax=Candidatus Westeberhardia cardiocondylae TaxID=1594731 RepID=A0A0H5BWV7_9ENTR|nr:membrane-bound lytic murein transglycosylase MltC [Candidatus Westeberhardia cardiocondylae]CEN32084.1 Membrane-bound lytic murein transglycosylase C [Candidatus Westeberhardia cardiocondylae]
MFLFFLLISCINSKNILCDSYINNTNGFDILIMQFANHIEDIWGLNEILIAGPKDYVKYSNQYTVRSHINFSSGYIIIETISSNNLIKNLRKEIINILLMNDKNRSFLSFFYINKKLEVLNKEPFLYKQVLDNDNKPIFLKWQAARFADYLLSTHLKCRLSSNFRKIWSITIQLIPDHLSKRIQKYLDIVQNASRKYGVDQSLILSIIQIESSFNPYAISHADALGLMQVVQHSAGRDVFKMQGKWGQPSRIYLLDPENNINTGTAYLFMLQSIYLNGIINPISKRYAVIAAYNSGVNSVLGVFSKNHNQALQMINSIKPDEVFHILYHNHPSLESRSYLYKVNSFFKNNYNIFSIEYR